MKKISKQIDEYLAKLAWSLWTELGVAGLERKHQTFSISPEDLILLTSVLSEFDPRLRDEALDWCTQYHRFISPYRLQILAKKNKKYLEDSFSIFSATLNSVKKTKWFVFKKTRPLKFQPSGKSNLRNFKAPSMIYFRLKSFFGVGVRTDILAFLLSEELGEFSISDLLETGYSKRYIAEILEDLAAAGILHQSQVRNQLKYSFISRDLFIQLLGGIPKEMIHWHQILAIVLPIRACVRELEETPMSVKAIDLRNLLNTMSNQLLKMKLTPPPLQNDFEAYWNNATQWFMAFLDSLARGELKAKRHRSLQAKSARI